MMLKDFPRPQALNPADSSPDTSRWPLLLKPEKKDIKRGLGKSGIHIGDYDCVCVCVCVCVYTCAPGGSTFVIGIGIEFTIVIVILVSLPAYLTKDKMTGWHHRLNGHEFEQTPGDSEGQGSLVCCSPRGHKKSDTT